MKKYTAIEEAIKDYGKVVYKRDDSPNQLYVIGQWHRTGEEIRNEQSIDKFIDEWESALGIRPDIARIQLEANLESIMNVKLNYDKNFTDYQKSEIFRCPK